MKAAFLCVGLTLLSVGACKKTGSGGGGGGGSWLVGTSGLMVNVETDGTASSYDLPSTANLNGIACRWAGEAWVVGDRAVLLYTNDAGLSWAPALVPTTADLRAIATQDSGYVFVAGNGVFLASTDTGANWASLGDGTANFRSVAAAQDAETVLAIADDGRLFSFENQQLVQRGSFAGARVVAVSPDGKTAFIAGDSLLAKSSDAGRTWTSLASPEAAQFNDARIENDGTATTVGARGTIAHVAADNTIVMQHVGTADLHTFHIAPVGAEYENVGFAGGDNGTVFMTLDGGWTWKLGPNVGQQTVLGLDQIGEGHR